MTGARTVQLLKEVADINPRLMVKPALDAVVSFVPMSAVDQETGTMMPEERLYGDTSSGLTPFIDGDVLVAKITPCFENGKIAQAKIPHSLGIGSTEFHVLRSRPGQVESRYLFHYLRQDHVRLAGERRMTGSAGQRRVPQAFLSDLPIPTPPLPEQRRIAAILDKADALRAYRRAALSQLDALAKSIFRDSLLSLSPANYDTLANVADLKRGPFGGALKKDIFVASGYKVYEQGNAIKNDFTVGRYFISEAKFQQMVAFAIQADDLIVSCSGSLGRVALVPNGAAPGIINQALLRIRPNQRRILPIYMRYALESDEAQRKLSGMSHGTGLQNFPPMTAVKALAIPVPEINIQKSVCSRIATVEQLRESFESSQVHFDDLFASLQHRAFRGEL